MARNTVTLNKVDPTRESDNPVTVTDEAPPTLTAAEKRRARLWDLTAMHGNAMLPVWRASRCLERLTVTVTAAIVRNLDNSGEPLIQRADVRALVWLTCGDLGSPGLARIQALEPFNVDEGGGVHYLPNSVAYLIDAEGELATGLVRLWCDLSPEKRIALTAECGKFFKRDESKALQLLNSFVSPMVIGKAFQNFARASRR